MRILALILIIFFPAILPAQMSGAEERKWRGEMAKFYPLNPVLSGWESIEPRRLQITIMERQPDQKPARVRAEYSVKRYQNNDLIRWMEVFLEGETPYCLLYDDQPRRMVTPKIIGANGRTSNYSPADIQAMKQLQQALLPKLEAEWAVADKQAADAERKRLATFPKYNPDSTGTTNIDMFLAVARQLSDDYSYVLDNFKIKPGSLIVKVLERSSSGKPSHVMGWFDKQYRYSSDTITFSDWIELFYEEGLPYMFYFAKNKHHLIGPDEYSQRISMRVYTPFVYQTRTLEETYSEKDAARIKFLQKQYLEKETARIQEIARQRRMIELKKQQGVAKNSAEPCFGEGTVFEEVPYTYTETFIDYDGGKERAVDRKVTSTTVAVRPGIKNECGYPIQYYVMKKQKRLTNDDGITFYEGSIVTIEPGETIRYSFISKYFDEDILERTGTVSYLIPALPPKSAVR